MTNPTKPTSFDLPPERWPGYDEQSWSQRFAELDRRYSATINSLSRLRETAASPAEATLSKMETVRGSDAVRSAPPVAGEVERLREALTKARNQFRFYEDSHSAKGTKDGDAKAQVNADFAHMCAAALGEGDGK